jgi:Domain of unknown function (DUF4258)
MQTQFLLSKHALKRASQRGITELMIESAIYYGEQIHRQGLIFFALTAKGIPKDTPVQDVKNLSNVIVVMTEATNVVLTCYKNAVALKNIKKKSKWLYK